MNNSFRLRSRFRRPGAQLLGFGLALVGAAAIDVAARHFACSAPPQAAAAGAAQKIADHFSSVQTMSGEFVQFGPRGEQTGGKFFIQRPGKIRFNYDGAVGYHGDFRRQVGGRSTTSS